MKRLRSGVIAAAGLVVLSGAAHAQKVSIGRCTNERLLPETRISACKVAVSGYAGWGEYVAMGDAYRIRQEYPDALSAYSLALHYSMRALSNATEPPPLESDWSRWGKIFAQPYEGRALVYAQSGQYEKALSEADAIMQGEHGNADALARRCWIKAVAGKDLKSALDDCNAALSSDSESQEADEGRALSELKSGNLKSAKEDCDAIIGAHSQDMAAYFLRGVARELSGEAVAGKVDIAKALAVQPPIAEEFANYGVAPPEAAKRGQSGLGQ